MENISNVIIQTDENNNTETFLLTDSQRHAYNVIANFLKGHNPIEYNTNLAKLEFKNKNTLTLIGYAGTGKSTLTRYLLQNVTVSKICVSAPTHKAKKVISTITNLPGETIQSLLGLRLSVDITDFNPNERLFDQVAEPNMTKYNVVIIDECSMINEKLYSYILDVCHGKTKVIFIGDACQLPPINEDLSPTFKNNNVVKLTNIVRQSNDNPLIEIYNNLRNDINLRSSNTVSIIRNKPTDINTFAEGYTTYSKSRDYRAYVELVTNEFKIAKELNKLDAVKVLAFTNARVNEYNKRIRKTLYPTVEERITPGDMLLSYVTIADPLAKVGADVPPLLTNSEEYRVLNVYSNTYENFGIIINTYNVKLVCLATNYESYVNIVVPNPDNYKKYIKLHEKYVEEGKAFGKKAWGDYYEFRAKVLIMDDLDLPSNKKLRRDIDYSYAITIHKSQGSTYIKTFVDVDDICVSRDILVRNKLLYVALTRCSLQTVMLFS